MNWLELIIELATIVPEAISEIKAVGNKALTSKMQAAQLAATNAATIAAQLSPSNAATAAAVGGAVGAEIGAVATALKGQ